MNLWHAFKKNFNFLLKLSLQFGSIWWTSSIDNDHPYLMLLKVFKWLQESRMICIKLLKQQTRLDEISIDRFLTMVVRKGKRFSQNTQQTRSNILKWRCINNGDWSRTWPKETTVIVTESCEGNGVIYKWSSPKI